MTMVSLELLNAAYNGDVSTLRNTPYIHEDITDENLANCLHYSARSGSISALNFLLHECRFNIEKRTSFGSLALHEAAICGQVRAVKYLLDRCPGDEDAEDLAGCTIVHLAALYRQSHLLHWLLSHTECDLLKRSTVGALPLHYAVVGGDTNSVKLLLEVAPTCLDVTMKGRITPVFLAAQHGHTDIISYLVHQHNADVTITTDDGMTCLHAAAEIGKFECVKMLIEAGSNLGAEDHDGRTVLDYAAVCKNEIVINFLKDKYAQLVLPKNLRIDDRFLPKLRHPDLRTYEHLFNATTGSDYSANTSSTDGSYHISPGGELHSEPHTLDHSANKRTVIAVIHQTIPTQQDRDSFPLTPVGDGHRFTDYLDESNNTNIVSASSSFAVLDPDHDYINAAVEDYQLPNDTGVEINSTEDTPALNEIQVPKKNYSYAKSNDTNDAYVNDPVFKLVENSSRNGIGYTYAHKDSGYTYADKSIGYTYADKNAGYNFVNRNAGYSLAKTNDKTADRRFLIAEGDSRTFDNERYQFARIWSEASKNYRGVDPRLNDKRLFINGVVDKVNFQALGANHLVLSRLTNRYLNRNLGGLANTEQSDVGANKSSKNTVQTSDSGDILGEDTIERVLNITKPNLGLPLKKHSARETDSSNYLNNNQSHRVKSEILYRSPNVLYNHTSTLTNSFNSKTNSVQTFPPPPEMGDLPDVVANGLTDNHGLTPPPSPPLPPPPDIVMNGEKGRTSSSDENRKSAEHIRRDDKGMTLAERQQKSASLPVGAKQSPSSPNDLIAELRSVGSSTLKRAERKSTTLTYSPGAGLVPLQQSTPDDVMDRNLAYNKEKELQEIDERFSSKLFIDKVPPMDSKGQVMPNWKRQLLARQLADRAKEEYIAQKKVAY